MEGEVSEIARGSAASQNSADRESVNVKVNPVDLGSVEAVANAAFYLYFSCQTCA